MDDKCETDWRQSQSKPRRGRRRRCRRRDGVINHDQYRIFPVQVSVVMKMMMVKPVCLPALRHHEGGKGGAGSETSTNQQIRNELHADTLKKKLFGKTVLDFSPGWEGGGDKKFWQTGSRLIGNKLASSFVEKRRMTSTHFDGWLLFDLWLMADNSVINDVTVTQLRRDAATVQRLIAKRATVVLDCGTKVKR